MHFAVGFRSYFIKCVLLPADVLLYRVGDLFVL